MIMTILKAFLSNVHWSTLLLAIATAAQRDFQGETSTYNQNGLVVSFKNLRGKDIQRAIDYPDATTEEKWSDCLESCVKKVPLCYGFDYTPFVGYSDSTVSRNKCWLKYSTFEESDATVQSFVADAAMLSPDLISGLHKDCKKKGLRGCFENGRLNSTILSTLMPSTTAEHPFSTFTQTSSATSIPTVVATDGGLSIGAKAGIGAGAGSLALLVAIAAVMCILRRRRRKRGRNEPAGAGKFQANIDTQSPPATGSHTYIHQYESPVPVIATSTKNDMVVASQGRVHEIDGSERHEK